MADPGSGAAVDLCRPLLLERVQRVAALRVCDLRGDEHEFHVRQCAILGPRLVAHPRYRRDHHPDQRAHGDGQSGGVIPGLVLAWVGFKAGEPVQAPMAEQGILWLVTLIPAVLFVLAIFVIGQYELSDEKIDELNAVVTKR